MNTASTNTLGAQHFAAALALYMKARMEIVTNPDGDDDDDGDHRDLVVGEALQAFEQALADAAGADEAEHRGGA